MEIFKKVLTKLSEYAFAAYVGYEAHKEIKGSNNNHNEQFIATKIPEERKEDREISNLVLLFCLILAVVLIAVIAAFTAKVYHGLKKQAERKVMRALAA